MIKHQWIKAGHLITALLFIYGLTGCSNRTEQPPLSAKPSFRQFSVLAVNDIYNVEGIDAGKSGSMARLRHLRQQLSGKTDPVLLLHAGDFLFPSSMSAQFDGRQMIDLMNGLDGEDNGFDKRFFVVFGNHEFDKSTKKGGLMLAERIAESDFYWLGTNINFDKSTTQNSEGFRKSLINNAITVINGVKVGIYGLTTDIVIPEYATINNDYLRISKRNIVELKAKGAEVIIGVTHLKMAEDQLLLEQLGEDGPDVIFGGHEHARQYACVNKRCVVKADADIRSATIATITVSTAGEVDVDHRFSIINETTITPDAALKKRTDQWISHYEAQYCQAHELPADCLFQVIGKTDVQLIAEELEIRRFETNLGSYVADQMVSLFDDIPMPGGAKVQVGLLNAGRLRLNQNIPAGTDLNEWYLNGIFQYRVALRVIQISGKQLKAVMDHSVANWKGNGWWLQVSGLAFRHDTKNSCG
jgi:2',3'-cyclic-nucleotide 2'-phosphodiesterase (5'-nucleotidase family)